MGGLARKDFEKFVKSSEENDRSVKKVINDIAKAVSDTSKVVNMNIESFKIFNAALNNAHVVLGWMETKLVEKGVITDEEVQQFIADQKIEGEGNETKDKKSK